MTQRSSAVFDIPGPSRETLRCSGCTKRACESLASTPGVGKVECDGSSGKVRVEYDSAIVSQEDLSERLDQFGMDLTSAYDHAAWRVEGLD